ncbi:Hypothetical_protein [Hexamita inflata]|uniref:Hypothetical_protein n=1 Tax=Hexamita inflata TaxID=28002 RepID=A0AA86QIU2_9EUKA|nr:Hypothetical protein HINF_LOCUS44712 [Hexamita inflata]
MLSCSVKHRIVPYSQIQELLNNRFLIWVFSGVFLTRIKSPSPCNPREYSDKDQCPLQNGLDSLHSRTNSEPTGYNRQARHAEQQLLTIQRPDRGGKFLRRRHVQLDRVKFVLYSKDSSSLELKQNGFVSVLRSLVHINIE